MPEIISYQPKYAEDFKNLNIAWLEKYFVVEPYDLEVLSFPEKYILEKVKKYLPKYTSRKYFKIISLLNLNTLKVLSKNNLIYYEKIEKEINNSHRSKCYYFPRLAKHPILSHYENIINKGKIVNSKMVIFSVTFEG